MPTMDPMGETSRAGITRMDIEAAARRLEGRLRRTPVIDWVVEVDGVAVELVCKLELLQYTGSFKPRGAFNRLLSEEEPIGRVVAASGGNHGKAVAYAARALGLPATIYVPRSAPEVKVAGIAALGAEVVQVGETYADALAASEELAALSGVLAVHAYDDPEVVAGQGTVGAELERDAPELDAVLVATGGGGLLGGIAAWYGTTTQVICVEPEGCPTMHDALAAGHPVEVEVGGLASDSLGARKIGQLGFDAAVAAGVLPVLVSEQAIADARRRLFTDLHLAAEPGGVAALAAVLSGAWRPADGARVGVVLCGANADPADLLVRA